MALVEQERRDLPFLLVNPPLTDPTCPYHSISYLLAATEAKGLRSGRALDANVEARLRLVASNSFGFGGSNACLVFGAAA